MVKALVGRHKGMRRTVRYNFVKVNHWLTLIFQNDSLLKGTANKVPLMLYLKELQPLCDGENTLLRAIVLNS